MKRRGVYDQQNPSPEQSAYMSAVGCGWHTARRHELLRQRIHTVGMVEPPDVLVAELARHGVVVTRETVIADVRAMQQQYAERQAMAGVVEDPEDVPTLPLD